MTELSGDDLLNQVHEWWSTSLIDIHPGSIRVRGFPIEDLIGEVSLVDMVWLMLRGELPTRPQSSLLEAALVSGVDHGPHAPSIAVARMAVTCGLPLNGAIASAVNMLDDVHGGAGQQCMELYADVSEEMASQRVGPDDVTALSAITAKVLTTWRDSGVSYLPGFGHRFHPVDPRAGRLLRLVDAAAASGVVSGRFVAIGRSVADALGRGRARPIPMNIDGATAVIYSELGFPPPLGRGLFVLSRTIGVLAHAWEQTQQGGRIKGPLPPQVPVRYTGPAPRSLPPRVCGSADPVDSEDGTARHRNQEHG